MVITWVTRMQHTPINSEVGSLTSKSLVQMLLCLEFAQHAQHALKFQHALQIPNALKILHALRVASPALPVHPILNVQQALFALKILNVQA